jgi:hypothetical protein
MSPEQATADRHLDGRSDIYSLAAVLYELLAGEPPHSGPTVQAVFAKLLTERPTPLRVLRASVPEGLEAAVMKGLAKVPADRFRTAAEFAEALQRGATAEIATSDAPAAGPARGPRRRAVLTFGAAGLALAAGVWAAGTGVTHRRGPPLLTSKSQLTFTGTAYGAVVSPDGRQLLYGISACQSAECDMALDIRDVEGAVPHRLLTDGVAHWGNQVSPDHRNVLAKAVIRGQRGTYLIPTSGAPPTLLDGDAAFTADGDSLLLWPSSTGKKSDSAFHIRIASLDGVPRDSIRVAGPGLGIRAARAVPGTGLILLYFVVSDDSTFELRLIDRRGRELRRQPLPTGAFHVETSKDAIWLLRGRWGSEGFAIVRVPMDARSGRIGAAWDTLYDGNFSLSPPSPTADGASVVFSEGTVTSQVWVASMSDGLRGRLPPSGPVLKSSGSLYAAISSDGKRVLIARTPQRPEKTFDFELSTVSTEGGPETPLSVPAIDWHWTDSVTVNVMTRRGGASEFSRIDVRTGERSDRYVAGSWPLDSLPLSFTGLPGGGWVWLPAGGQTIEMFERGRRRTLPRPPSMRRVFWVRSTRAGDRIFLEGTVDPQGAHAIGEWSPADGTFTEWLTGPFAKQFDTRLDGTLLVFSLDTIDQVTAPGRMHRVGILPKQPNGDRFQFRSASADFQRAIFYTYQVQSDAWLYRVSGR